MYEISAPEFVFKFFRYLMSHLTQSHHLTAVSTPQRQSIYLFLNTSIFEKVYYVSLASKIHFTMVKLRDIMS